MKNVTDPNKLDYLNNSFLLNHEMIHGRASCKIIVCVKVFEL